MTNALTLLTDESLDQQAEASIRALIAQAVALREAGDSQASYDLLTESESIVESVSMTRQGRFFNQRALALKDLGEYDRAILQFDCAAECFQKSGELNLQGMVNNNIARVYSLLGNHERARESVETAKKLITDPLMRGQAYDQSAKIYLDENKPDLAEIESREAVKLLHQRSQSSELTEAMVTHAIALILCGERAEARSELEAMHDAKHKSCADQESVLEDSAPKTTDPRPTEKRDNPMAANLARSRELLHAITANDDAEHAWEMIELLDIASGSDNPIIEHDKRFLYTLTREFEEDFQRRLQRVRPPPIEEPTTQEH